VIIYVAADIIGFQEMETFRWPDGGDENLTLDWLLVEHPQFAAGAIGDPAVFPSTQPILYRTDRFTLLDQGWFFFSSTPDEIYSRTFNGSFPAFVSWIKLEEIGTDNVFRVVNLHTDFASYSNRRQSLELVADRINPWLAADAAVLVIGDFNVWHHSRLLNSIKNTGLSFAPVMASTYHFNRGLHLFPAIDHIAYSSDFGQINQPVVLQQKFLGEWPADHHPVVVDMQFR
jgi:endonuclease/exonuclease/phosphatase family metal-dependent hydrolase